MKRSPRWLFRISGVCVILYLGWELTLQIGFGLPGRADFYLHRKSYQSMVETAKTLRIPPGQNEKHFLVGLPCWILRDRTDHYLVTILTKDWGHAGRFGYIYSDDPYSAIPADDRPEERTLPVAGTLPLFVTGKINDHWWVAHDPLD